ncbi:MAG: hypothetical protein LLG20_18365 [Acidobacteriales bacterium]|nr:hypothetical protein [Terriglobales bacterium]
MLIDITDDRERAAVLVEMHKRWEPTMQVSLWGRAKATRLGTKACRDREMRGAAKYPGDCDNCAYFMGAKTEGCKYWGDIAPACCALDLEYREAEAAKLGKEPK